MSTKNRYRATFFRKPQEDGRRSRRIEDEDEGESKRPVKDGESRRQEDDEEKEERDER